MQKIRKNQYLACPDHVPDFRVLIPKILIVIKAESDPTLTQTLGILSILGLPVVKDPYWTVYFAPRWKREEIYKRINYLTISAQSYYCYSTPLTLVNFCPVLSEFLTWSFVYKNFWYFGKNCQWKSSLHFQFKSLHLHHWSKKL